MKKTRFLALVLVVAIALMGAGYAYWTEALEIGTTVKTGELEFAFRKPVANYETLLSEANAVVGNNDNKLKVTWDNVSPGARFYLKAGLHNTGTIDAGITNFNISGDDELLDNIHLSFVAVYHDGGKTIGRYNSYEPITKFKDVMEDAFGVNGKLDPIMLTAKDDDVEIHFGFYVDPDAKEEDFPEDSKFNFEITADILQINEIDKSLNKR